MHISDGILTETTAGQIILAAGTGLALAGAAIGLRKTDYEKIPSVAVLSSAFFVASLIHVKIGPTSVHLILNGLMGLILGWAAFPAFLVALFLQAIFFGHGGLTTLGLNAFNFGISSLLCFYLFNASLRSVRSKVATGIIGAIAGALSIMLAAAMVMAELLITGESFVLLAQGLLLAHLPVAVIEGVVTGSVVLFLRKVRPAMLESPVH